jgi:hypothetical protein
MILASDIIGGGVVAVAVALAIVALLIDRRRDPIGLHAGTDNPDTHMEPMRRPGLAEKTLTTDLRQRRMLLRPHGLSEASAAWLAAKVARRATSARPQRKSGSGRHRALPVAAAPLLAAPLAPEAAHEPWPLVAVDEEASAASGLPIYVPAGGPLAVLTQWAGADTWVGDLGPAELAGPEPAPERAPRRQRGRFFPGIAAFHVLPVVVDALAAAAKAEVTVYPGWETGSFAIVDAGMWGAAR